MDVNQVALKSKSEKEAYGLMRTQGNIFLPPFGDTHSKFISQITWGDKLYLKCSEVRVCKAPHLKTLNVEWIEKAKENTYIDGFCLIIFAWNIQYRMAVKYHQYKIGERFRAFIMQRQQQTTDYILDKKQTKIWALPEFIKLFKIQTVSPLIKVELIF